MAITYWSYKVYKIQNSMIINVYRLQSRIYKCYNLKILELVNKKNLVLELIQENSIENSVQNCLPYTLITHGSCLTILVYSQ